MYNNTKCLVIICFGFQRRRQTVSRRRNCGIICKEKFHYSKTRNMSLKPKRVEFDKIWPDVLKTIKGVITCGPCERHTWNERFRYPSNSIHLTDLFNYQVLLGWGGGGGGGRGGIEVTVDQPALETE